MKALTKAPREASWGLLGADRTGVGWAVIWVGRSHPETPEALGGGQGPAQGLLCSWSSHTGGSWLGTTPPPPPRQGSSDPSKCSFSIFSPPLPPGDRLPLRRLGPSELHRPRCSDAPIPPLQSRADAFSRGPGHSPTPGAKDEASGTREASPPAAFGNLGTGKGLLGLRRFTLV